MMNLDPRLMREAQRARRWLGLTVGLGAAAGLATALQARVLSRTVSQVFLEGQYWYDYIKSLGWETCADFHITGIPKLDPLFWPGHYNNRALAARLGLAPVKKTVLFAPSYRPSCIEYIKEKQS